MPYTIILAATRREAVDWARQNDVPFRSIRFAQDASSLGGRFFDRIVELPSHAKRRDRFSVNAAVKRLKRVLPDIPHEVLDSFTLTPPAPSPAKFTREQWLFGDVDTPNPFSNAAPLAPGYVEVTNDTGVAEVLVQPGEDLVADRKDMDLNLSAAELREVGASEDEVEQFERIDALAQKIQDDIDAADMDEASEVAAIIEEQLDGSEADLQKMLKPNDTVTELQKVTEAVTSAAPKRKSRRTNEQKAYDEAAAAYEALGDESSYTDLEVAHQALLKRHPDDERLGTIQVREATEPESTPGVASGAPDLDF